MSKPRKSYKMDTVFTIEADSLPRLQEWMDTVEQKYAQQQVATGRHFNGTPLHEHELRMVRDSIERGDPTPYYGAIGGAYEYSFVPTGIGTAVKVRNVVTGDAIDLTDYEAW